MPLTTTLESVPVHGGLASPVDRLVPVAEAARWTSLPRIEVNETDRTTLYRIADGTLSPLVGPMGKADYRSVIESASIERNGRRYAWTIPIGLPVTDAEAATAQSRSELALVHGGTVFGRLHVQDVHDWNKVEFVETVYGRSARIHRRAPGWRPPHDSSAARSSSSRSGRPSFAHPGPKETRALVAKRGFEQTVAFQTRNPLHRRTSTRSYGARSPPRDRPEDGRRAEPARRPAWATTFPRRTMKTYEALVEAASSARATRTRTCGSTRSS
jgi:sulfate adenylyltransferase